MRILLGLHHFLNPNLGAPGATLAIGAALQKIGCEVEYFAFDQAFSGQQEHIGQSIRFPWRMASFLARHAADFDVIDVSTGDVWVWASSGRPGGKVRQALVTRSHGLEHVLDQQIRAAARKTGERLSWKYPLYHGGFRLWEVAQSLRCADHCILLNDADRDIVHRRFHVELSRLSVLPMGISTHFCELPAPQPSRKNPQEGLRLTTIGSWITRKGKDVVAQAASRLHSAGVPFRLLILGAGLDEASVLAEFDPAVRPQVRVVPRYDRQKLPSYLAEQEVLLFPSFSEGFSTALIEGMACGLTPIATPVGGNAVVIRHGVNGFLVPMDDAEALANVVRDLSQEKELLLSTRRAAQQTAQAYDWDSVAAQTLRVYEKAIIVKDTSSS